LALCLILGSTLTEAAVSCSISSSGLSFGIIDPLYSVEITSTGAVNLNCTGGSATYTIHLSQGYGSMAQRLMKSGLNNLKYNLYTSNSYSSVLGDGTAGSLAINGSSATDTLDTSYLVYGKISNIGLSRTEPGVYNDNVLVTIIY
jgi:spore coat protein U-like protein